MNKIKTLIALMLYMIFAAAPLIATPSKEVTDRLTAELHNIRKNTAQGAIHLFEKKYESCKLPQNAYTEKTLANAIADEKEPLTTLNNCANQINRILANIIDGQENAGRDSLLYSEYQAFLYNRSELTAKTLYLQLCHNRFLTSAIAYFNDLDLPDMQHNRSRSTLMNRYRAALAKNHIEEAELYEHYKIRCYNLTDLVNEEKLLKSTMSDFATFIQSCPSPIRTEQSASTTTHKRLHVDDTPDEAKRTCIENAHDVNPVALLHSRAKRPTDRMDWRSNIMSFKVIQENLTNYTRREYHNIARTMIEQATQLDSLEATELNVREEAYNGTSNYRRRFTCAGVCSSKTGLWKSLKEYKTEISQWPIPSNHSMFFIINKALRISELINALEADHIKDYEQNTTRMTQLQTLHKRLLATAIPYFNAVKPPQQNSEEPYRTRMTRLEQELDNIPLQPHLLDHERSGNQEKDRYDDINRFENDLNLTISSHALLKNELCIEDEQKILDLQRIYLANKVKCTLFDLEKMHAMLQDEQNSDDNDSNNDDDDDSDDDNSHGDNDNDDDSDDDNDNDGK